MATRITRSSAAHIARRALGAVALGALSAIAACSPSSPSVIAKLEVSGSSAYLLNGRPVESGGLFEALRAAQTPGKALLVHVVPAPDAPYDAVRSAMAAVQQAGGQVGIVGNERF